MYTKQGDITLGEISSITSQTKFQNLVAAATDVWISAVSRKAWDQRIQAILLVCEPIDVGDASHLAPETNAWLDKYLLKKPPREEDEWLKAAEAKLPFIRHEKVHIFLYDFRNWLELNTGEQATSHALGRRLRQCQARTEKINVKPGNSWTSRTTWQLPERYHTKPVPEEPAS